MNDFTELETVVHLARLGSYSATAEKMYTTQPNISKRIKKIESELDVTLFGKKGKKLTPTESGETYLRFARKILKTREDMLSSMINPALRKGLVRVGASETVVFLLLSKILNVFRETFPQIRFDLQINTSNNLKRQLLEEQIDVAFLIGGVGDPDYNDIPMVRYEMGWHCSKESDPGVGLDSILADNALITFPRDTLPYKNLIKAIRRGGFKDYQIHNCASLSTLVNLTVNQTGIGIFPKVIATKTPWADKLKEIKGLPIPPLDYYVSYLDSPQNQMLENLSAISVEAVKKHDPNR